MREGELAVGSVRGRARRRGREGGLELDIYIPLV